MVFRFERWLSLAAVIGALLVAIAFDEWVVKVIR